MTRISFDKIMMYLTREATTMNSDPTTVNWFPIQISKFTNPHSLFFIQYHSLVVSFHLAGTSKIANNQHIYTYPLPDWQVIIECIGGMDVGNQHPHPIYILLLPTSLVMHIYIYYIHQMMVAIATSPEGINQRPVCFSNEAIADRWIKY